MGKAQPVIGRQLVNRHQQILPLGHPRQRDISMPEVGTVRAVFAETGWVGDENDSFRRKGSLPDMLLVAEFAGPVILGGRQHIVRRFMGDLIHLPFALLPIAPLFQLPGVPFPTPDLISRVDGDCFYNRRQLIVDGASQADGPPDAPVEDSFAP